MSAIGGPCDVSMPWPLALREAGARLLLKGERPSGPEAEGCSAKYEVAPEAAGDCGAMLGEGGLVSRRRRPWEDVVEGMRGMGEGSVLVLLCTKGNACCADMARMSTLRTALDAHTAPTQSTASRSNCFIIEV